MKGVKHSVLDDGVVMLVDTMGDESAIVQAARVSYGDGTKTLRDDVNLIRYLMQHRHTTPFEMVELKFLIRCPMDVWRQWIRHRTASVNEYSTRYSNAIDSAMRTKPDEWRVQSGTNKQGSGGYLDSSSKVRDLPSIMDFKYEDVSNLKEGEFFRDGNKLCFKGTDGKVHLFELTEEEWDKTVPDLLSDFEVGTQDYSRNVYELRIAAGVAREQARKDLPLSTYTEAYWKIDLHNLLHFLGLRMDPHAQKEIREYANKIGEIVQALYPNVWKAFECFRLQAVTFYGDELEYLRTGVEPDYWSKRREDEFQKKKALIIGTVE